MGCECPHGDRFQTYHLGGCTYKQTMQGCEPKNAVLPMRLKTIADYYICALRYPDPFYLIATPWHNKCPDDHKYRICGGKHYATQFCIHRDQKCPINDVMPWPVGTELPEAPPSDPDLIVYNEKSVERDDGPYWEKFDFTAELDIILTRQAD